MKKLLLLLALLPSLAFAQRGGAIKPLTNLGELCSLLNATAGSTCAGYDKRFCMVPKTATCADTLWCDPTSRLWLTAGQCDTANTPTVVEYANRLSANGTNCNNGSAPQGVSEYGSAENCTAFQQLSATLTSIVTAGFCSNGQILKSSGGTSWACSADSTGGTPSFDTVASGTNTSAAMVVGNGASLAASGTGTIAATEVTCTGCVAPTEIAAQTSAQLATILSDETGTGVAVFGTAPTMTNPVVGTQSANDNTTKAASTAYVQTELTAYASDTVTETNKTYDAEGTGNTLTIPTKVWLPAAGCQASTATSFWDSLTANPAAAACVTGTNTQKGTLDFDPSTDQYAQQTILLPADWTGSVDAKFVWLAAATSGNVIWSIATICVADAETDDPSFNTASTVTDAAKGTANQVNTASITGITTTGCAAGELMHINVSRNASNGSDTMAGNARLIGVELTMRRAM